MTETEPLSTVVCCLQLVEFPCTTPRQRTSLFTITSFVKQASCCISYSMVHIFLYDAGVHESATMLQFTTMLHSTSAIYYFIHLMSCHGLNKLNTIPSAALWNNKCLFSLLFIFHRNIFATALFFLFLPRSHSVSLLPTAIHSFFCCPGTNSLIPSPSHKRAWNGYQNRAYNKKVISRYSQQNTTE